MKRIYSFLLVLLVLLVLPGAPPLGAQTIQPGILVMKTSSLENTVWTGAFGSGVFDTGSDEISDAKIFLQGVPLAPTAGPASLEEGDTIIKLNYPVTFNSYPQTKGVLTKTVAISLRSAEPITVTHNGGQNPELWDLRICLADSPHPDFQGSILLTNECNTAGTFSAVLEVEPKVLAIRRRDGYTKRIEGVAPFAFTARGTWTLRSAAPDAFAVVAAGATIDANCDGTFETTLPASSEIILGVARVNCNALNPQQGFPQIQRIDYKLKQNLVLEPATRDDRSFPFNESALPKSRPPGSVDPHAATGLGVLAALGLAAVVVPPHRKPGKEVD